MNSDVRMRGFQQRARVDDVLEQLKDRISPLSTERRPFDTCLDRILAEEIRAPFDVPPFPKSAMDGYAVRSTDGMSLRRVVGEITANLNYPQTLQPGEALRIMTGAAVPKGADAVVMAEHVETKDDHVQIKNTPTAGQHILRAGEDLQKDQIVLHQGQRLRPQDIAMLISVGALEPCVYRRPRVRLIPTGSELVPTSASPQGSQLRESNSAMLRLLCLRDGGEPTVYAIHDDAPERLRHSLFDPGADLIVIMGGSSVGKEDFAPVVVRQHGELLFHGVQIRPASPTGMGLINNTPVVMVPGFPVASYVAWDVFVRPIIQRMLGLEPYWPYPRTFAQLAHAYTKPAQRVEIQRFCWADRGSTAEPRRIQLLSGGAALLSTLTRADGFVYLPEGTAEFASNTVLSAFLYSNQPS